MFDYGCGAAAADAVVDADAGWKSADDWNALVGLLVPKSADNWMEKMTDDWMLESNKNWSK